MDATTLPQGPARWVGRWTQTAAWSLIVLSAVAVRLPGIGRPFWLDEAWVANSALAPSLRGAFLYDTWLQTTPPMFLIAIRIAHKLFGGSEIPFRAVPFALGVAAVLLALLLGRHLFGPVFGLFLGAMTAVSPALIDLSLQLKQYSADLFCAFLLMILIWIYSQSPTGRNFARLLIGSLFCLPLAYTTAIFLPLAGFVVLGGNTDRKTTMLRTAMLTLFSAGMLLILQLVFIRPNRSPELVAYWYAQGGFPPRGQGIVKFYRDGFRSAFYMFYSRSRFFSRLCGVLAVCGVIALLCSIRNARSKALLALTCLPILTVLGLNMLLVYPFNAEKLDIFIFPCLAVLVLCGASAIAELLASKGRDKAIFGAVSIAVCVALTITASWFNFRRPLGFSTEDPVSAVRFLERAANPGDLVYVHASAEEQIKLYLSLLDVHGLTVAFGNTGWPCCTRHHQFETGPKGDSYVMLDFKNQTRVARPGRILLVFADRTAQWEWLGRNERQIILQHVHDMSCQHIGTYPAGTIVIDDLRCEARGQHEQQ